MNKDILSRGYLENISFADLIKLADKYGIDVPENLNRNFLIGELLELEEESNFHSDDNMIIDDENDQNSSDYLPQSYNETQISCILRNPVWAFVYWNISDSDNNVIKSSDNSSLNLRVCLLNSSDDLNPVEVFEINTSFGTQEQYVLLPAGSKFFRIELVYKTATSGKVLAFTPVVEIPQGAGYLNDLQPGNIPEFSKIAKLSGIEKIVMDQYKNHRHSFS